MQGPLVSVGGLITIFQGPTTRVVKAISREVEYVLTAYNERYVGGHVGLNHRFGLTPMLATELLNWRLCLRFGFFCFSASRYLGVER